MSGEWACSVVSRELCLTILMKTSSWKLIMSLAVGWIKNARPKVLIVRPLINMCVFSPPLTITIEQIGEMFDIIEESLVEVSNEML